MQKAFIVTDLEGTAGVTSFRDETHLDSKYLDHARRLATAELNAAVDGLVAAGVTDVLVFDGHGAGGLWYEDIHPQARLLHGRPLAPRSFWAHIADSYEVGLIVGQHAMAGVRSSNMNHTQSSERIYSITLNGKPIGEIAQLALYHGAAEMPFIFLSGEEEACREARELIPGITTVAVKEGIGRHSAISLSSQEARSRIRRGVEEAVKQHRARPVEPLKWPAPYVLVKRFMNTDDADSAASSADAVRLDERTVEIRGDSIRELIYR